ncbi:MAG: RDD family protein [Rickettsia endosymbiont of Pseudomimeciton antennatum]|nr:RDD family protein [Rickettsia endosymbiont of Pseudomimeciton antennatum]
MNEYIYCGFWRRITARLFDYIIMILICIAVGLVWLFLTDISLFLAEIFVDWVFSAALLLLFLYIPIFESSSIQATPGCYILGMKIINKNGTRIGFFKSLFRFITLVLINSTGILLIANIVCIICTDEKVFLHDILFGTRMIRR